jgi:hypothetical protein
MQISGTARDFPVHHGFSGHSRATASLAQMWRLGWADSKGPVVYIGRGCASNGPGVYAPRSRGEGRGVLPADPKRGRTLGHGLRWPDVPHARYVPLPHSKRRYGWCPELTAVCTSHFSLFNF